MAARDFGEIYAIGDVNLTINAEMFLNEATWDSPSSVRLPSSGSYTGCAKVSTYELSITNPASDSTFSFPLEYTENDIDWYTSTITGTVYKSLGGVNIAMSVVKSTIGETTYSLAGLCSSSLVNKYSYYKPNGSAPYKLGDFRWYAHGALGGTFVTYVKPTGNVSWGDTYTVRAIGSRRWVEITGKPYATSRVILYQDATEKANTEVNFNNVHGAITSYTTPANKPATETVYTWYAKTEHYYSSAWVEGSSETFTVTVDGKPWSLTITSGPTRVGDTAGVTLTYTGNGHLIRFSIMPHAAWEYVDHQTTGNESDFLMEVVHVDSIGAGKAYKIEVYHGSTWELEFSGTLP